MKYFYWDEIYCGCYKKSVMMIIPMLYYWQEIRVCYIKYCARKHTQSYIILPDCGGLLPRFCDYSIDCHISLRVGVAAPAESLVTGVEEGTRRLLMIVISSYQQSTMVYHCDTIATVESLRPGYTTISRYI